MNKISDLKIWAVGDRIITPANQRGLVTSADKKIGITWENGLSGEYTQKQIQAYDYQEFLEEEGAIASCYFYTPVSSQESPDLNSELKPPEHPTSLKLNYSSKITPTPNESSNTDFLVSPSTAISKTTTQSRENSTAGATRLEQKLRPYIAKGDKLNPAVPGWMMGFPVGWAEWPLMDTGETILVQLPFIPEYATTSINDEIVTTSTPDQSAPSKLRSQSNESAISPISPVTRANAQPETYIINQSESLEIIKDNLGFGFVVNWLVSEEVTYNWERDDRLINKLALAQPAAGIAPQSLITKFLEDKSEPLVLCPSCELQHIYLSGGCGMCGLEPDMQRTQQSQVDNGYSSGERPKADLVKNDLSQPIPENFLKETEPQPKALHKPKGKQRKGCLYRYVENKKLKNGSIASYPRVNRHRQPDNPTHWRWGYNWEEKIDGEWKGRSIGSVPVGAVPMIQSMQREGASSPSSQLC